MRNVLIIDIYRDASIKRSQSKCLVQYITDLRKDPEVKIETSSIRYEPNLEKIYDLIDMIMVDNVKELHIFTDQNYKKADFEKNLGISVEIRPVIMDVNGLSWPESYPTSVEATPPRAMPVRAAIESKHGETLDTFDSALSPIVPTIERHAAMVYQRDLFSELRTVGEPLSSSPSSSSTLTQSFQPSPVETCVSSPSTAKQFMPDINATPIKRAMQGKNFIQLDIPAPLAMVKSDPSSLSATPIVPLQVPERSASAFVTPVRSKPNLRIESLDKRRAPFTDDLCVVPNPKAPFHERHVSRSTTFPRLDLRRNLFPEASPPQSPSQRVPQSSQPENHAFDALTDEILTTRLH